MADEIPMPDLPPLDPSGRLAELITPDNPPPGAEPIVVHPDHGDPQGFIGRVVARELPCTVPTDKGPGCGGTDRTLLARFPVTGRNLPGEDHVGQAQFCPACGIDQAFVTATAQEIGWGWVSHVAV